VLERVLDVLLPRLDDPEVARGIVGGQDVHLVGHLGAEVEHDVALVLRRPRREEEALVRLLVDEDVVVGRRAEPVAPELVRAHGVVGAHVEERRAVRRPGGAVVGALDLVVELLARLEVAEAHRVQLGAGEVGRVGQQAGVGGDVEGAEGEELRLAGHDVLVEHHDLAVPVPVLGPAAAVDRVLPALLGAGVVPPRALAGRHGEVGFLDARADLGEQLLLERLGGGHHLGRVGVLGFEVGDRVGVVPVAQPGVLVHDRLAVPGALDGDPLRHGRRGHGPTLRGGDNPRDRSRT
jgi:hypothetical protein